MNKLVIFDLDGTLVNTLPDISRSLNLALCNCGYNANYTLEQIKAFIGSGEYLLIKRSLASFNEIKEENIIRVRKEYSRIYHESCNVSSCLYDGILEQLNILKDNGFKIAVLSNKPHSETTKVVNTYFPSNYFDFVRGGMDGFPIKPDVSGVELILEKLNIKDKTNVYYVGDSNVDMQTGLNASLKTIGTSYGYCTKEVLLSFNVYKVIDDVKELSKVILN